MKYNLSLPMKQLFSCISSEAEIVFCKMLNLALLNLCENKHGMRFLNENDKSLVWAVSTLCHIGVRFDSLSRLMKLKRYQTINTNKNDSIVVGI